jgi:hypothetical protein
MYGKLGRLGGDGLSAVHGRRCDLRRLFLMHEQMRVGEFHRLQFGTGNNHAGVELGEAVQPHGEIMRHADAAMRGRVADIRAFMHGDARPGDALHVRHRRIAVDVRTMEELFLDDAEDAERRRMARYAGGD